MQVQTRIAEVNKLIFVPFVLLFLSAPSWTQNPGSVTGNLQLWLKAGTGVYNTTTPATNGQPVQKWVDQSLVRINSATSTSTQAPIYNDNATDNLNYNPVVTFQNNRGLDFGNDYLFSSGTGTQNGLTFISVLKPKSTPASSIPLFLDIGNYVNSGYGMMLSETKYGIYSPVLFGGTNGSHQNIPTPGSKTTLFQGTYELGVKQTVHLNGGVNPIYSAPISATALTSTEITENPTHIAADGPFTIGRQAKTFSENSRFFEGHIGEIIGFNRKLTATEMTMINTYLALKYAITLDNTGGGVAGDYVSTGNSTLWQAAFAPSYHHHVIGIARDDATLLNQKQSHSSDDSTRIYINSLAYSNALNTGTISTDLSAVICGQNKGKLYATTASNLEVPAVPFLFGRIEREWKITKTNFAQPCNVDIQLDVKAEIGGLTSSDIKLLIDEDGDFTNATLLGSGAGLTITLNGKTVTISGLSTAHIPNNSTRFITLAWNRMQLSQTIYYCPEKEGTATATVVPGNNPFTYLWNTNPVQTTAKAIHLSAGWHTVSITDANGAVKKDSVKIVAFDPMSITLTATEISCNTAFGTASVVASGGTPEYAYLWENNARGSSIQVSQAGVYSVKVTDVNGCLLEGTVRVTAADKPSTIASYAPINCERETLLLHASDSPIVGCTYQWTGPNGFISSAQNPIITNARAINSGKYKVVIKAPNGCSTADSVTVNIHAFPNFHIQSNGPICEGSDLHLKTVFPEISNLTFSWTGPNGYRTSEINPTLLEVTDLQSGKYVLTVKHNNCASKDSLDVRVIPLPKIDFEASKIAGCSPVSTTFTYVSNQVLSNVVWDFGDGLSSNELSPVKHTYKSAGNFNVTLTVANVNGCKTKQVKEQYILIYPTAVANFSFSSDNLFTDQSSEVAFTNLSENATLFRWNFGDQIVSEVKNPTHQFPPGISAFNVMLIANNSSNCPDTVIYEIALKDPLIYYIPNSFTPWETSYNKLFKPIFTSGFIPESYQLHIYNRWGQVVFHSNQTDHGWDGTFDGHPCSAGTYTWTVQFRDKYSSKAYYKTGHVNLLK